MAGYHQSRCALLHWLEVFFFRGWIVLKMRCHGLKFLFLGLFYIGAQIQSSMAAIFTLDLPRVQSGMHLGPSALEMKRNVSLTVGMPFMVFGRRNVRFTKSII